MAGQLQAVGLGSFDTVLTVTTVNARIEMGDFQSFYDAINIYPFLSTREAFEAVGCIPRHSAIGNKKQQEDIAMRQYVTETVVRSSRII